MYVLTLVHGTWPNPDGWVAARSFLRRELASRLGEVIFREFSWDGTNTQTARTEGGASLARFIRAGQDTYPDARHFVIAHSHGGNVALYAMQDAAARRAVDGIVTLATPFLFTRRRNLRPHADVMAWVLLGVLALAALALIDVLGVRYGFPGWLLGSALVMVKTSPGFATWLVKAGTAAQTNIVPVYQPPCIDRSRLFIVSPRGDEAGRWLRAWETVAKGPFVVGCLLLAVVEVGLRSNFAVVLDRFTKSTLGRGLDDIHVFGLDGLALAITGLALCVIWGLVLPLFSGIVRWPGYWREPVLANVLVEIGSNCVPIAGDGSVHMAHTFEVPRESLFRRIMNGRLRHSAICEHPAVVAAIGDWIRDRSRPPDGDDA